MLVLNDEHRGDTAVHDERRHHQRPEIDASWRNALRITERHPSTDVVDDDDATGGHLGTDGVTEPVTPLGTQNCRHRRKSSTARAADVAAADVDVTHLRDTKMLSQQATGCTLDLHRIHDAPKSVRQLRPETISPGARFQFRPGPLLFGHIAEHQSELAARLHGYATHIEHPAHRRRRLPEPHRIVTCRNLPKGGHPERLEVWNQLERRPSGCVRQPGHFLERGIDLQEPVVHGEAGVVGHQLTQTEALIHGCKDSTQFGLGVQDGGTVLAIEQALRLVVMRYAARHRDVELVGPVHFSRVPSVGLRRRRQELSDICLRVVRLHQVELLRQSPSVKRTTDEQAGPGPRLHRRAKHCCRAPLVESG